MATANPKVEFAKADYLRDQSHVINTFIARIEESVSGEPGKAGLMQDFKARLERGEVDVHHHHAEFQPEAAHDHHEHDHQHSHDHSHGHGHAPYRHIGHPHGPRTMINENVCCCFMGQFPQEIIDQEQAGKPELEGTPSCKRSS